MHFLIRMALVLAAGAAGWTLAKKRRESQVDDTEAKVVYLGDEDAVIGGDASQEPEPMHAVVRNCYRRMDPLTLNSANEAVFTLDDGKDVKLHFSGEGGLHLQPGDQGMLTWKGDMLILFEKDSGDVIGGMFYAPAGEAGADE